MIGFLIGPLQQYYIGQETFKYQSLDTPSVTFTGSDVPDLLSGVSTADDNLSQVAQLRGRLASTSRTDHQPQLWQESVPNCTGNTTEKNSATQLPLQCIRGGTSFENISTLLGPYITQLPSGFQTGLIAQYVPRMNSSISYAPVPQNEFPQECNSTPNAYYEQSYNRTALNVRVCMPNSSHLSWNPIRDRQDMSESMYLSMNASMDLHLDDYIQGYKNENGTYKIQVNTSLGYFELPNYSNNATAGPLLDKDPFTDCKYGNKTCRPQVSGESVDPSTPGSLGPLAMTAAAMFGQGSFIANQLHTDASTLPDDKYSDSSNSCIIAPLNFLVDWANHAVCYNDTSAPEVRALDVAQWLQIFAHTDDAPNAMNAAVIIASQIWLSKTDSRGSLKVVADMGQDSIKPKISSSGIIVMSILLFIDLSLLLALAAYASFSHTWTRSFDPLTMMRLGAARADHFPLQIASTAEEKERVDKLLEQMPGWVGDATPDAPVGALALGSPAPLRANRLYLGS